MRSRHALLRTLLVAGFALLASGCGGPHRVTYVDPNGPTAPGQGGGATEPVARFGSAALERAKSFVRIRSALAAGRTLAASDPGAAAEGVQTTVEEDLAFVEPRLVARDARLAASLRSGLEGLAKRPPANAVGYAAEVRRLTLVLDRAEELVLAAARQDIGFRADVLYETLTEASVDYEASFDGGTDRISMPDQYRRAYGLVVDASTRQLEAVPETGRGVVRAALDRVARRSLPGPTPPDAPRNPDKVLGELGAVADQVAQAAGIDPTAPTTDADVPDQLRALKRGVAAAVETWERGDRTGGLAQLAAADREHLQPAASGVAAVSVALLGEAERGVLVDLPRAMRSDGDVVAVGADVDADLDEAITQVETELELLRDSG